VIGYFGSTRTSYVETLQLVCGRVSIFAAGPTCQITIAPGTTMPTRGSTTPTAAWFIQCPAGQAATVANGHAGGRIDQMGVECAPLGLSRNGASYQLTIGAPGTPIQQGGPGGTAFRDVCPAGQIANGSSSSYNGWISTYQLLCATPSLVP
jgi:hypothetical protein